jgi:hypothetical protein
VYIGKGSKSTSRVKKGRPVLPSFKGLIARPITRSVRRVSEMSPFLRRRYWCRVYVCMSMLGQVTTGDDYAIEISSKTRVDVISIIVRT